ncbi:unnamed protein product, partial [Sphacelaria rigidula]
SLKPTRSIASALTTARKKNKNGHRHLAGAERTTATLQGTDSAVVQSSTGSRCMCRITFPVVDSEHYRRSCGNEHDPNAQLYSAHHRPGPGGGTWCHIGPERVTASANW